MNSNLRRQLFHVARQVKETVYHCMEKPAPRLEYPAANAFRSRPNLRIMATQCHRSEACRSKPAEPQGGVDSASEVNFDCLVGPTHNYGGLSVGNIASVANAMAASSPREAALQGLAKMKLLADMGIKQAVLPPQDRPVSPP